MNPSPDGTIHNGILSATLALDGAEELGRGLFTVRLDAKGLTQMPRLVAVAHATKLNIAVGVHPLPRQVIVLINTTASNVTKRRYVFTLPPISTDKDDCLVLVRFRDWCITDVSLDDLALLQETETLE